MEWIVGGFFVLCGLAGAVLALLSSDAIGGAWLVYWHGEGESHQYQFYRCHGCRNIVTHRHIITGGCACHESIKISPAKLRRGEKLRLLFWPWSVTSPRVRRESVRRLAMIAERALHGQTTVGGG